MRSIISIGFLLALSFLSMREVFAEPIRFKLDQEEILIETDGGNWKISSQQDADGKGVTEYTAEGEMTESWSERVSINYFKGMQGGDLIKRLMDFTKKGLEGQCVEVKWENIAMTSESALYWWSAKGCVGVPDQSELARELIGKDAFYVFHYANKDVPMPAKKVEVWKGNLAKISAKES